MTQSPHHPALQEDEARFINRASMGVVITEDHVVRDGSALPGAVKSVAFLNRKPGLSVEEFQRHWRDVHAPIASGLPASGATCRVTPAAPPTKVAAPRPTTAWCSHGSTRRRPYATRRRAASTRACSPTPPSFSRRGDPVHPHPRARDRRLALPLASCVARSHRSPPTKKTRRAKQHHPDRRQHSGAASRQRVHPHPVRGLGAKLVQPGRGDALEDIRVEAHGYFLPAQAASGLSVGI